jgi:glycosyltransferase involved in cell wall biosynthesis
VVDGAPRPAPDGEVSLWDLYAAADFVTYPSLYEGFGNAFLEAVYFRVPVLINRYSIFVQDIEPKAFRVVAMDGIVTSDVVDQVRRILSDDALRKEIVDWNYVTAGRYYSYANLRRKLNTLVVNVMGLE